MHVAINKETVDFKATARFTPEKIYHEMLYFAKQFPHLN